MAKKPAAPARSKRKALSPAETLAVKALAGALGDLESKLGINARPTSPLEQARRAFYLASKLYASAAIRPPAPGAKECGPELLTDPTFVALREALPTLLPSPAGLDQRVIKALAGLATVLEELAAYAAGANEREGRFGVRLAEASRSGLAVIDLA